MSKLRLPASTQEYVYVRVKLDGDTSNPTTSGIDFALLPRGQAPTDTDFTAAEWLAGGPPYRARQVITGPGAGDYQLWVRVAADPENPVRAASLIQFFDAT